MKFISTWKYNNEKIRIKKIKENGFKICEIINKIFVKAKTSNLTFIKDVLLQNNYWFHYLIYLNEDQYYFIKDKDLN